MNNGGESENSFTWCPVKLGYDNNKYKLFMAATDKKNIYEEYLNADIFAFPSRVESFGMVLVEAMQYKLPVIGFKDCEGSRRLIFNNLNGLQPIDRKHVPPGTQGGRPFLPEQGASSD